MAGMRGLFWLVVAVLWPLACAAAPPWPDLIPPAQKSQPVRRTVAKPAAAPVPVSRSLQSDPADVLVQPETAVPPRAEGACGSVDFWIVSSHPCEQGSSSPCPACEFDYIYMGADRCPRRYDAASFQAWLEPATPLCIAVHGSFATWESLYAESPLLATWLKLAAPDRRLQVVFYTWPSESPIAFAPQVDVGILGWRSSFNALYLAQLLGQIPADKPVCFVGHSHGARMVCATLHLLAGGVVQDHRLARVPPPRRLRTVLLAAAMDHDWLNPGDRYGCALNSVEMLLNVKSTRDIALFGYPARKLFSSRALGRKGFGQGDYERMGPRVGQVAELDVTPLIGTGHLWHNYYREPAIATAMVPYVYFTDGPAGGLTLPTPAIGEPTLADPVPPLESPDGDWRQTPPSAGPELSNPSAKGWIPIRESSHSTESTDAARFPFKPVRIPFVSPVRPRVERAE